jgi:hypothetical protein
MTGHNAIANGAPTTDAPPNGDDRDYGDDRPHVYSDAVVSAPLITWFGLPTLIELAAEEFERSPLAGGGGEVRDRSHSFSHSDNATRRQQRQGRRGNGGSSDRAIVDDGDDDHAISAYTYRVRTLDHQSSDDHHLLLCQNSDGSYSHVAYNEDGGMDDAPASETSGLLLPTQCENALRASMSLDVALDLEETLTRMDDGTLPPHVHPSIPIEMLDPEYTRTTPALKLWPLAVLVFYSEKSHPNPATVESDRLFVLRSYPSSFNFSSIPPLILCQRRIAHTRRERRSIRYRAIHSSGR